MSHHKSVSNRRLTLQHGTVCGICHSENVRRDLVSLLSFVKLNHFLRVNGQLFVRVHHDTEQAGVGLDTDGNDQQARDRE